MTNKDNDQRKLMDEHPHVESEFKDSPQYMLWEEQVKYNSLKIKQ